LPIKKKKLDKPHYGILAHLLKGLVAERFKRMARDEVLFKFISSRVDPAVLVDHSLRAEREALDLAEMSLLELVDSERMDAELHKSAEKIQSSFQKIFGNESAKEFVSSELLHQRIRWLKVRIDFYRKWMGYSDEASSPTELAKKSFRSIKSFDSSLKVLFEIDRQCADEIVRATPSLNRFLMRKQLDYDLKSSEDVWQEFKQQAFRKVPELAE
jgi:hypothetical protein